MPKVAAFKPGFFGVFVDKHSIDILPNTQTAAIVYDAPDAGGGSFIVGSDGTDFDAWTPEQYLELPLGDSTHKIVNPIVKLSDQFSGYVEYMLADVPGLTLGVARISRGTITLPWFVEPVAAFRMADLPLPDGIPGALNRTWSDRVPVSFAVGGANGRHLYLAFRSQDPKAGVSVVQIWDCDDSGTTCTVDPKTGALSANWHLHRFYNPAGVFKGSELQPSIAASRSSGGVAVSWYQASSATDFHLTFTGVTSNDSGANWKGPFNLRPSQGSWLPCPTPTPDSGALSYYGDYNGSVILPFPLNADNDPWVVTGHADSDHCLSLNEITNDQHVQGVLW